MKDYKQQIHNLVKSKQSLDLTLSLILLFEEKQDDHVNLLFTKLQLVIANDKLEREVVRLMDIVGGQDRHIAIRVLEAIK